MSKSKYPLSDHYDGKLFFNPGVNADKSLVDVFRWKLKETAKAWPRQIKNNCQPNLATGLQSGQLALTFINHVTFLIQFDKLNILTDPVFGERTSPFAWAGPRRVRPPGLEMAELPHIDVVLVSHNHYDHMDLPSLQILRSKFNPLILVPLGNRKYFTPTARDPKNERIIELDWWQDYLLHDLGITLTPAQHWSSRTPFDRRKALWGGFMLNYQKQKIFFAGDTGYGSHFLDIQKRLGRPTLALLPIGAYEPRWFMKTVHMNPEDAVLAHKDLASPLSIAMHFGTWQLTDEAIDQPTIDLKQALGQYQISESDFQVLEVGETRSYGVAL